MTARSMLLSVLGMTLLLAGACGSADKASAPQKRLVYAKGVREWPDTPVYQRYEIAIVQPGGRPEKISTIGGTNGSPPAEKVFLLRESQRVLVILESSLVAVDLSTHEQHTLYQAPQGYFIYGTPLVGGGERLVAFTEQSVRDSGRYQLKLLDLTMGDVREVAGGNWHEPQGEFRGLPVPLAWSKDGESILLLGVTFSDNCCFYGRIAFTGAAVEALALPFGYPSPDGEYFASNGHTGPGIGCYTTPRHQVLLYDLTRLERSTIVAHPERVYRVNAWSPDSDSFIFTSYALRPSERPDCGPEPDPATAQVFLAHVVSGQVELLHEDDPKIVAWSRPTAKDVTLRCDDPDRPIQSCKSAVLEVDSQVVDQGGPFAVLGWLP